MRKDHEEMVDVRKQQNDVNQQIFQKKTNNQEELHKEVHKEWQIFLFAFIKYKQNPFDLTVDQFTSIILQIINRNIDSTTNKQSNTVIEDLSVKDKDTKIQQQLPCRKDKQHCQLDHAEQNQKSQNKCQQQVSTRSQTNQQKLINQHENQHQQKQKQQNLIHKLKQQNSNLIKNLQLIPQIEKSIKEQFIEQIMKTKEILSLQMVVNIYSYINVFTFMKYNRFLNKSILYALVQKFNQFTIKQPDWVINQKEEESQQKPLSTQRSPHNHNQLIKTSSSLNYVNQCTKQCTATNVINQIAIIMHIRHKLQIQAFFQYYQKKTNKSNNIIKMLNSFCNFLTHYPLPKQFDYKFYIHTLHTEAYKRKQFLIANIMNSKCFYCPTQRFISNSVYQIRIYQKLMRKLNNIIYHQEIQF